VGPAESAKSCLQEVTSASDHTRFKAGPMNHIWFECLVKLNPFQRSGAMFIRNRNGSEETPQVEVAANRCGEADEH
jgi:hypothetical protein